MDDWVGGKIMDGWVSGWVSGNTDAWMPGREEKQILVYFSETGENIDRVNLKNRMLMIFRPKRDDIPDRLRKLNYEELLHFSSSIFRIINSKIRRAGSVPCMADMRNACIILLRNLKGGDLLKDL
jgi:hypothetical protein